MESQEPEFVIFPACLQNWTDSKLIWNQSKLLLLVREKAEEMRVYEGLRVEECLAP